MAGSRRLPRASSRGPQRYRNGQGFVVADPPAKPRIVSAHIWAANRICVVAPIARQRVAGKLSVAIQVPHVQMRTADTDSKPLR